MCPFLATLGTLCSVSLAPCFYLTELLSLVYTCPLPLPSILLSIRRTFKTGFSPCLSLNHERYSALLVTPKFEEYLTRDKYLVSKELHCNLYNFKSNKNNFSPLLSYMPQIQVQYLLTPMKF